MRSIPVLAIVLCVGSAVLAQKFDPPKSKTPDAATLKLIEEQTAKLREAVKQAVPNIAEVHRADVEVYLKAAEWIVRHQEWFTADSGKQTLAVIEQGLKRAEEAKPGKTPWLEPKGRAVARGYRSRIDNSVQPYGVVYPVGYGEDPKKKWRLDVFLHGRDSTLTEVKHLYQHAGREAPKDQDYVQLSIYGRGNNAYRWAGEEDVFEVMEHFRKTEADVGRKDSIDLRRVVLKGFSMGGAGAWHIGLRHPDRFAVLQPGAGFTTTHGYVGKLPATLPDYQEKCLRIYDAYRYAENAFNVPIVAYSGELDPQKKAADNIESELKRLGLGDRMVHLIGPGLEHRFPVEWQKKAELQIRACMGDSGRALRPKRIRFVTYSLKNAECDWVKIAGIERQYERAVVEATWEDQGPTVKAENVSLFGLLIPDQQNGPWQVTIDGQQFQDQIRFAGQRRLYFEKSGGRWRQFGGLFPGGQGHKLPGLQGPIDDAFTGPYLCVVGTGKPMHPAMHTAALAQLERFRIEWNKYMRGDLPVRKDTELSIHDFKNFNLVLFGDPGSNSLIKALSGKLKYTWTADTLKLGDREYAPGTHLPMLIQQNPEISNRYIVLNSGHTFHEADFKGTNALLYPRLGDYAVVKPTPTEKDPAAFEVVTAGLFDEWWQFPKK
jgi:hypothetical protein